MVSVYLWHTMRDTCTCTLGNFKRLRDEFLEPSPIYSLLPSWVLQNYDAMPCHVMPWQHVSHHWITSFYYSENVVFSLAFPAVAANSHTKHATADDRILGPNEDLRPSRDGISHRREKFQVHHTSVRWLTHPGDDGVVRLIWFGETGSAVEVVVVVWLGWEWYSGQAEWWDKWWDRSLVGGRREQFLCKHTECIIHVFPFISWIPRNKKW